MDESTKAEKAKVVRVECPACSTRLVIDPHTLDVEAFANADADAPKALANSRQHEPDDEGVEEGIGDGDSEEAEDSEDDWGYF